MLGGPPGESAAFEEGTITLETQSLVDTDGNRIALTDVEDDVVDSALKQLSHNGAGGRHAVAPPPVVWMGKERERQRLRFS